jgi:hypothetical protein
MRSLLLLLPPVQLSILVALSLVLPLSIFFGRGTIRRRRLSILDNLEQMFSQSGRPDDYIPLQLVRDKYSNKEGGVTARALVQNVLAYLMPTSIFVVLSAMGFYLVLVAASAALDARNLLMVGLFQGPKQIAEYQAGTAIVISAAFIGSYIWSVNYLILRVANFDLTPLDFLRTSTHILLTTIIAGVFRHVIASNPEGGLLLSAVLLIAFLMGLFPALGLNVLVDRLPPSVRIKRVPPEAREIGRELPLDLIDGIGSSIKFRLANYEIEDVQNLATENPIHLYVATPYSLCQVIDWVAQAQLLLAIGPARFVEARKRAVHDIFNLFDLGATPKGRSMLAGVVLDGPADDEATETALASLGRSLYVQRLLGLRAALAAGALEAPRQPLRVAAE